MRNVMKKSAAPARPPYPPASKAVGSLFFLISGHTEKRLVDFLVDRYGSVISFNLPLLGKSVVVLDQQLARQVMSASPDQLISGRGNALLKFLYGDTSVFLIDGEKHKRLRQLLVPPFRSKDTLKRYTETITQEAEKLVATLPRNKPFNLLPMLRESMLEIILKIIFGVADEKRLTAFRQAMTEVLDVSVSPLASAHFALRHIGGIPGWKRLDKAIAQADALIYEQITLKRQMLVHNSSDDILSMLITTQDINGQFLSDIEIRDQLVTLLIAGHETTATSIAWALERLIRTPAAYAAMKSEALTDNTRYVDAVIKESLRLKPPIPFFSREVKSTFKLGEWLLPARTLIVCHMGYIQKSFADSKHNPREFCPERYLDENTNTTHWIPFGGGLHSCIGNHFAMLEMRIFLKTLLNKRDFLTVHRHEETARRKGILDLPANDLLIKCL